METFLYILLGFFGWWLIGLSAVVVVKKFFSNTDIALKSRSDYITVWIFGPFSYVVIVAYIIYGLYGILVDMLFTVDKE